MKSRTPGSTIRVRELGLCVECGLCQDDQNTDNKQQTKYGAGSDIAPPVEPISNVARWEACPGKGVDYPSTYASHFGYFPPTGPMGVVDSLRVGFAADRDWRRGASSGGVISRVLHFLLLTKQVDAVIVARQRASAPLEAEWAILDSPSDILATAQSVYTSVPMLAALDELQPGLTYAMTCLPDQSAALRVLQGQGVQAAQQITTIIGPFVGTGLEPAALDTFLAKQGISRDDVSRIRWRDGEWPGSLAVTTKNGDIFSMPKFYYNHLTPSFVDRQSLQSMDFYNEFADIAVGDAWSPAYEERGEGFSLVVARNARATALLDVMEEERELVFEDIDTGSALDMHAHMRDFKNRGSYIRNRIRRLSGLAARDTGTKPINVPKRRYAIEVAVSSIFIVAGSPPGRLLVRAIPDPFLGPAFASLRVRWKSLSKRTKRLGLQGYGVKATEPRWSR